MTTAGKVLIILIILVSMFFMWMSASVLEARNQWDIKVKKKADEAINMAKQVDLLANGSPEGRAEFDKLAKAVLELGSAACRAEYDKRVNEGFEAKIAFEMSMAVFLDQKTISDYQKAVTALNDLEKQPTLEEAELERALAAYTGAEKALSQARSSLDTAYSMFFGQTLQQPGVRGLKGLSIDAMRDTVSRVQRAIAVQKTTFETLLSDGEKNFTELADRVKEVQNRANTLQKAATSEELERDERIKEVVKFTAELNAEQSDRDNEMKLRDAEKAALAQLQKRFDQAVADCRLFVLRIKVDEIEFETRRGLKTAVLLPNGKVPAGKVQQVAEDGTIQVNLTQSLVAPGVQLHVYRWDPEAEYVGILEVIRADSDGSVGRMLPEFRQRTIRRGDWVSSEINPKSELSR